ncbi:MAG TPA: Gfo/Idh/MocA family oxidoreductase [Polyangiaceae bacterium]|nr:Gfo/Idh/MocA family oxidoreductase [Polyangiaceae bacterium]
MTHDERRIRYAVVGAGNIAQVAVLPAFEHAKANSELAAIVTGDAEKRRALQQRYGVPFGGDYSELESMIEVADIDAVYIATPNSLHKEFAVRAACAGAHVLCEKPLAPSSQDCRAILEACESAGRRLMVAYRLHFERATLQALEIARSGRLGEPRLFSSFFSHVVRADDIRRDAELAGGATFDLGVYCINAARQLFEAEPELVLAEMIERDGTDDTVSATLRFPGQRLAQFCVSNSVAGVSSYRIAGSEGDLRVEPAFEYIGELIHHLTLGDETKKSAFKKGDQFAPELKYFSDCILNGREPEPSGEEGWCDVRVVEAILESARTHRAVSLAPYARRRRPTKAQADQEPPVKKPPLVHAPSPSEK